MHRSVQVVGPVVMPTRSWSRSSRSATTAAKWITGALLGYLGVAPDRTVSATGRSDVPVRAATKPAVLRHSQHEPSSTRGAPRHLLSATRIRTLAAARIRSLIRHRRSGFLLSPTHSGSSSTSSPSSPPKRSHTIAL